ncbi:MAG: peptidylprolyl isomerase [Flavobacteriaceae bacterium]|nr:peptidylprolyl isomerase [Flavobacteriaceae bacterium]
MTKIKHILFVLIVAILVYACKSDDPLADNFDHAAQAVKDNDTLVSFFKKHYYDATIDSIKPLVTGKTALIDDPNLSSKTVTENEIAYKMYYYIVRQGIPSPAKGNPTRLDSVLTKYQGSQIHRTDQLGVFETRKSPLWFTLDATIKGWGYGFMHFKGGKNVTNNGPITYENTGKGYIFFPSGLGYRNAGNGGNVLANRCLMFRIELLDIVEDTDHDNDGLASYLEIEDGSKESDPLKVNTDGDRFPNYRDTDDDNDGKLTKDEDKNGDGDPRNDDTDGDGVPDYLDPDTK